MSDSKFSEFSAQDTRLAATEAQEWIEAVVGKKFAGSSFRESLENGILLCELMKKINPGSIRRINKSRSPIAYLDNIQQFLQACQYLDMNDAQLFDCMDLQEAKGVRRAGVKRDEADRRIRSVCITLYWLGRTVAEMEDYSGPQLDLSIFKKLITEGKLSEDEKEKEEEDNRNNHGHINTKQLNHIQTKPKNPPSSSPNSNGVISDGLDDELDLTFEQEQTADELLADIQNAVDEMLQDFQVSPVTTFPPPVAPKKKREKSHKDHSPPADSSQTPTHTIHMKSINGGFGFQVMGGMDSNIPAEVDYIVPGSAADSSGLEIGDIIISVSGQYIQDLSHVQLVGVIKKAGQAGEVSIGVTRGTGNKIPISDAAVQSHAPQNESSDNDVIGFSRRESHERWEEENQERERQAQEIALLYPQRNNALHTNDNGLGNGPPPSFGKEPLPTLVEHQEEALFEQFQEMLESAPPPHDSPSLSPPSHTPTFSPQSLPSPSHSSPPPKMSPSPLSPSNHLQDDRESIEREIKELAMMEANSPMAQDGSSSEEEGAFDSKHMQKPKKTIVSDNPVAIKVNSFQAKETSSPSPILSPRPEIPTVALVDHIKAASSPEDNTKTTTSPPVIESDEASDSSLDKQLKELLSFSQSGINAEAPLPKLVTTPPSGEVVTPLPDDVVTPPPMFDSPPPPKPKSVAPKRPVKRPAPPPPKPKPKPVSTPKDKPNEIETSPKPVSPIASDLVSKPAESENTTVNGNLSSTSDTQEAFMAKPIQRSDSPDLVTQMQQLAYSKTVSDSVLSSQSNSMNISTNREQDLGMLAQKDSEKNSSLSKQQNYQPRGILNEVQYSPQEKHTRPENIPLSSNDSTTPVFATAKSIQNVSQDVEIVGNIKIQRVQKTRWTPKSSSTGTSPAQTPDYQGFYMNQSQGMSATLPSAHRQASLQNGKSQYSPERINRYDKSSTVGGIRGIGGGARGIRPDQHKRYSQPMAQQFKQQKQQNWRSQEELRPLNQQVRKQRLASTPEDYRVQKTMSLPRGTTEDWRKNRANTWAPKDRVKDGYQVAYLSQASSPYDLCSRCHQALGQGSILAIPAIKTQYHPKCFVCRVCRGQLSQGGQSTTVMMKNLQPHCRFCISTDNGMQATEC